jgi:hypothetical protein
MRLSPQAKKHLGQIPCGAGHATLSLDAVREVRANPFASAPECVVPRNFLRRVANNYGTLKQQLFNFALTQLTPEKPTHRATDGRRRKTVAVTQIDFFIIFRRAAG